MLLLLSYSIFSNIARHHSTTISYLKNLKSQIELYTTNYTSMYALYKKNKRPNQMKINYISYKKIKPLLYSVYTISGARAELSETSLLVHNYAHQKS